MSPKTDDANASIPFDLSVEYDFCEFREVLKSTGFTAESVENTERLTRGEREARRLLAADPLSNIFHLFRDGLALPEQVVRNCLQSIEIEPLLRIGLLQRRDNGVGSVCRITFFEGIMLLADTHVVPRAQRIAFESFSSRLLAAFVPREPVDLALELWTGTGCQALLASRHATKLLATDVSARATNFAAMNARLNGITEVEFRQRSVVGSSAGEKFNLVVSNPPSLISPASPAFSRSELGGDLTSEFTLESAAKELEERGYAVLTVSWHYHDDDCWAERPSEWIENINCDVWWLRIDRHDPSSYIGQWLGGSDESGISKDEWLNYYAYLGARWLSLGVVVLRKRSSGAPNWQRFEDFANFPGGVQYTAVGNQIETIFAAEDLFDETNDDSGWLDQHFCLIPEHSLDIHRSFRDGRWHTMQVRLRSTRGVLYTAELDPTGAQFVELLDGKNTIREAAATTARTMGFDLQQTVSKCLALTRNLLEKGFVAPVTAIA